MIKGTFAAGLPPLAIHVRATSRLSFTFNIGPSNMNGSCGGTSTFTLAFLDLNELVNPSVT